MSHGCEANAHSRMIPRNVVYALAGIWGVLMIVSLSVSLGGESDDRGSGGLARMASFMSWQVGAFVVAIVSAAFTRVASGRGAAGIKLAGYLPLVMSVFIVGALVVIIAFRVLVQPAFA
jgi:hypothetical protein